MQIYQKENIYTDGQITQVQRESSTPGAMLCAGACGWPGTRGRGAVRQEPLSDTLVSLTEASFLKHMIIFKTFPPILLRNRQTSSIA